MINVLALASEVSGHAFEEEDANFEEGEFLNIVNKIFENISRISRWDKRFTGM